MIIHRPRADAAVMVAGHTVFHQYGRDIIRVGNSGVLVLVARRKVDQTAWSFRCTLRHCSARQYRSQRIAQIVVLRFGLLRLIAEAIINGATIQHLQCLRINHKHL